jgi:hypothetical protein
MMSLMVHVDPDLTRFRMVPGLVVQHDSATANFPKVSGGGATSAD